MAKGFKHGAGGSNPLNFKVVGNPQPQNPKENTIWVDTDVDITAYHFSSEPIFADLDYSNLTNADDVISGRGDNGENFYGSLPIMWSKTYLLKTKLIAGVTYKLDSTGLGYGRIGAFRKPIRDENYAIENYAIRIEGADPLSLLNKNRYHSIFTPIETTDAYFYYCTDADNTGSNSAFSVWFALYLVGNPVWISTGKSSPVAFNALKKNGIQICPLSAKQYIGGTWVDKTAKSWQGGAWVEWINEIYLYNSGDTCDDITGGWTVSNHANGRAQIGTDALILAYTGEYSRECAVATSQKIKFDGSKKMLNAKIKITSNGDRCVFGLSSGNGYLDFVGNAVASMTKSKTTGSFDLEVDISKVSGEYYVGCYGGQVSATISEIWME